MPYKKEEWLDVARKFNDSWNHPNCIGALDGKHVAIEAPQHGGSMYFNYKKFHSIVLMGLCDADYNFLYIDVGKQGRMSDGGVFKRTDLAEAMKNNTIYIPNDQPLPGRTKNVPFVIVADDAFASDIHVMKPFPGVSLSPEQRALNYRLSRARRTIENTFGVLTGRFRVLKRTIPLEPEKVEKIVLACCYLHNFLKRRHLTTYLTAGLLDQEDGNGNIIAGSWRESPQLSGLDRSSVATQQKKLKDDKLEFAQYFTENPLPWQHEVV